MHQILDVTELPTNPSLTSIPERLAYDSVWTVASTLDEARRRVPTTARKGRVAAILQDELREISLMGTSVSYVISNVYCAMFSFYFCCCTLRAH